MKLFTITAAVFMIATSYGQISPDPTSSGLEPGTVKTQATREDKETLTLIRNVIAELDEIMGPMKANISNLRYVQLVAANRELFNLIGRNAPRDQILQARRRVQEVREQLRTMALTRHQLCLQKWCLRACIRTFFQTFDSGELRNCESQCFLNNGVFEGTFIN